MDARRGPDMSYTNIAGKHLIAAGNCHLLDQLTVEISNEAITLQPFDMYLKQ